MISGRVVRYLILIVALVVLGVLGHLRLNFETNLLGLLPPTLPEVRGLRIYQENFSGRDEALMTIQTPTAEATEEAAATVTELLRANPELAKKVTWRPPWEEDPAAAAELLAWFWLNQPPENFARLTSRLDPANAPARLDAAVEMMTSSFSPMEIALASRDPYGIADPELLAASGLMPQGDGGGESMDGDAGFTGLEGRLRVLYIRLPKPMEGPSEAGRWYDKLKHMMEEAREDGRLPPETELGYTGEPVFLAEVSSQMASSMQRSVAGGLVLIAALFMVMYRRPSALLAVVLMLGLTLFTTVGLGGWLLDDLNMINVGFAAILLGLTADYAIILYQDTLGDKRITARKLRARMGPSIWGAATTTAMVFMAIIFSSFPGISQLGIMVAMGVLIGALYSQFLFAPGWLWWRRKLDSKAKAKAKKLERDVPVHEKKIWWLGHFLHAHGDRAAGYAMPLILVLAAVALLWFGLPDFDHSPQALRPRSSQAYDTLDRIQNSLTEQAVAGQNASGTGDAQADSLLLVTEGRTVEEVGQRLAQLRPLLERLQRAGQLSSFQLPDALWPSPENGRANLPQARALGANIPALEAAAREAGFQEEALGLLRLAGEYWSTVTPEQLDRPLRGNPVAEWLLRRFASLGGEQVVALGFASPSPSSDLEVLRLRLNQEGQHLANWSILGESLFQLAMKDTATITLPVTLLLACTLFFIFRRIREIFLTLASLCFSGVCLMTAMRFLDLEWNLMNIMAIPLLIGAGVDYTIHILVALKRHAGHEMDAAERLESEMEITSLRQALVFCALTTIAGFGSLAWSASRGLASLGLICALGIAVTVLTSVLLLPAWWRWVEFLLGRFSARGKKSTPQEATSAEPQG